MPAWDYRIIKFDASNDMVYGGEEYFEIVEVFYDDDGKPDGYGNPAIQGTDLLELADRIKLLSAAFEKPILVPEDFGDRQCKVM